MMWYAVQKDRTDAWDNGSHSLEQAVQMLKEQGQGLIAVIDEESGVCVDEIEFEMESAYYYGMRLRGFSPGCQPMDGLVERQDDWTGKYWDVLVYDRELSETDCRQYDLERIEPNTGR